MSGALGALAKALAASQTTFAAQSPGNSARTWTDRSAKILREYGISQCQPSGTLLLSRPRRGGVALAYEGAPMGLVSTAGREGAGRGAPPAPGRLFSSYRAPRGFGVFGHPCAKVLMGQWLFDTIPSKSCVKRE